jgi:hypothetical protein
VFRKCDEPEHDAGCYGSRRFPACFIVDVDGVLDTLQAAGYGMMCMVSVHRRVLCGLRKMICAGLSVGICFCMWVIVYVQTVIEAPVSHTHEAWLTQTWVAAKGRLGWRDI